LPFFAGPISDHRGLFLDIDNNIIDGLTDLKLPPIRKIGSKTHHKDRKAYKKYLHDKFSEHNIYDRAKHIYEQSTNGQLDLTAFERNISNLDEDITKWMKLAEKTTCKKRAKPSWNKKISALSEEIKYWNIASRGYKNNIDVSNIISKLLAEISQEVRDSIRLKTRSPPQELRECLKEKIKTITSNNGTDSNHSIKNERTIKTQTKGRREYITTDAAKRIFRQLKGVFKTSRSGGISHIEIPNPNGGDINQNEWINETNPEKIEEYLLNRNIKHFGQAEHTPFATNNMRDYTIGYTGSLD
jgi:hypothetical protein